MRIVAGLSSPHQGQVISLLGTPPKALDLRRRFVETAYRFLSPEPRYVRLPADVASQARVAAAR
jgi:hypothetical protein